jgi:tellurite resistance protein
LDTKPAAFDYVDAIAFELWTVDDGVMFDNILVCDSEQNAKEFALSTWGPKHEKERAAQIEEAKARFAQDESDAAKRNSKSLDDPKRFNGKRTFREFVDDIKDDFVWFARRFQKSPITAIKYNPLLAFNLAFVVGLLVALFIKIASSAFLSRGQKVKKSSEAAQTVQVIESSAPLNEQSKEDLLDSSTEGEAGESEKDHSPTDRSLRKRK